MALSMDEQRMLAEIERRLAAEDPGLAVRLSSFRRPGPAARLRTTRGRIIGSVFAVVLVAAVSLVVYAMVPFRAHTYKPATTPLASRPAASAPVLRSGTPASSPARTIAAKSPASKTATHPSTGTSGG